MVEKRAFKGVWIDKEIWLSDELSWMEKLVLTEIDSLDNEKGCFASNKHFAEFFKLSENRISKIIKSIKDKGYININLIRDGFVVKERIIRVEKSKLYSNGENDNGTNGENDNGTNGENDKYNNTSFNNTINNTKDIKDNTSTTSPKKVSKTVKKVYEEDHPYYKLSELLYKQIIKTAPRTKQPNIQSWCDEFRKMVELDKITDFQEIQSVILFAHKDNFWRSNILSAKKLREKYATLHAKMITPKGGNNNATNKQSVEQQYERYSHYNEHGNILGF